MKDGDLAARHEFGPRALGNLSIVADPRSPKMQSHEQHVRRRAVDGSCLLDKGGRGDWHESGDWQKNFLLD